MKKEFIKKWITQENTGNYELVMKDLDKLLEVHENLIKDEINSLDNWISVENPPKKSCDLILLQSGKSIVGGYSKEEETFISLMGYMDSYLGKKYSPSVIRPNQITHWQPLPQPPKQSTKKRGGCNP